MTGPREAADWKCALCGVGAGGGLLCVQSPTAAVCEHCIDGAAAVLAAHRKGKRVPDDWPTDKTARLVDLWNDGLPAAEIGERLGCTKNAVIGKANRLGLRSRAHATTDAAGIKPPTLAQLMAGR